MSNYEWNADQAAGERALREAKRRTDLDSSLGEALRSSGINVADVFAVMAWFAVSGRAGTDAHRIMSALRAIEMWLNKGGAK